MTILLYVLGAIGSIITLVLLLGLILKRDYVIRQSITISRPASVVFNYAKSLKDSSRYNKWMMADPNARTEYKGTDGTVGASVYWNSTSNQVGEGEQEIIKIIDGKLIENEIRFVRPFKGVSYTSLETNAAENDQTNVTWTFKGKHNYPFNAIFKILGMEKVLSKDLYESLTNLKRILEA